MEKNRKIVGLCGSLRKGSYNAMLLKFAASLVPEGIDFEIASFDDVPVYNADDDIPEVAERPASVVKFRDALAKADAFVIVSPEYNYSIPGGLKNAIDWASRGKDSPLMHKPVALMGATQGMWGTVRMQTAFLPVFTFLNMNPVLQPEVLVAQAQNKFDADGNLIDEAAIGIIKRKIENLISACSV
ncbi:NAD(P)H-dependent oxidoreductase [Pedobacter frigidisoli]|uniref:NAD(P)H-dependent oxidoreductase n=1 Tax=Pedobacter frigidisoli TaxID=2530455 RepID=A0A4R0P644_9SPHI|nr:NAD(P)H-dependent oxidoreductase [Pedobacter frigidisoli]TCD08379.1 NAD(P)H-dependent oxidoreductase [Pedobacter frigidisoli]